MQIQKQLSKRVGKKKYYKYVVVLSGELVKSARFRVGQKLSGKARKGEIRLGRKGR